jgi:hypothetical protein
VIISIKLVLLIEEKEEGRCNKIKGFTHEETYREPLKEAKKTVVGASRSGRALIGSETSDAPHRLRQPTTNLQLGDAPNFSPSMLVYIVRFE